MPDEVRHEGRWWGRGDKARVHYYDDEAEEWVEWVEGEDHPQPPAKWLEETEGPPPGLSSGRSVPGQPTRSSTRTRNVTGALLVVLGGLLIAVGSFLPWLTASGPFVGTITRNGIEGGGDGVLTLILGAIIVAIGAAGLANVGHRFRWTSILAAVPAGAIALIAMSDVQERAADAAAQSEGLVSASEGAGIWTILVGAGLVLGGGLMPGPSRGDETRGTCLWCSKHISFDTEDRVWYHTKTGSETCADSEHAAEPLEGAA